MPSESSTRERIAVLETWRDEHKEHHDRENNRKEGSTNRTYLLWSALIGLIGALIGAGVVAWVSYYIYRHL